MMSRSPSLQHAPPRACAEEDLTLAASLPARNPESIQTRRPYDSTTFAAPRQCPVCLAIALEGQGGHFATLSSRSSGRPWQLRRRLHLALPQAENPSSCSAIVPFLSSRS